jgi:hypothetical protein
VVITLSYTRSCVRLLPNHVSCLLALRNESRSSRLTGRLFFPSSLFVQYYQNNLATCKSLIFECFTCSRQDVTSIDNSIAAGLVTASITSEIQIESLDLSDITLSAHGCHAIGFVDHTLSCSHLGVEEAG